MKMIWVNIFPMQPGLGTRGRCGLEWNRDHTCIDELCSGPREENGRETSLSVHLQKLGRLLVDKTSKRNGTVEVPHGTITHTCGV